MRKKAPELIEEAEEDAHRKAREVGESSDSNDDSSGSGDGAGSLDGEDSEEQVEELLAEPNAFIGWSITRLTRLTRCNHHLGNAELLHRRDRRHHPHIIKSSTLVMHCLPRWPCLHQQANLRL